MLMVPLVQTIPLVEEQGPTHVLAQTMARVDLMLRPCAASAVVDTHQLLSSMVRMHKQLCHFLRVLVPIPVVCRYLTLQAMLGKLMVLM